MNKADSTTTTEIDNAAHTVVTSVPAGTTVHDQANVSDTSPSFDPTGDVTFTFFTTASNCTGTSIPAGVVALAGGVAHPSDPQGPLAAGAYSFRASYAGNSNFNESTSACEPLEVVPVGEGCTPGFWKTHPELWDGTGVNDVTTTIQTGDFFNTVFGVTSDQSGLPNDFTLLQAVDLNGGGLKALNRHAAAAAASADASGVDYAFTLAQVIAIYRDAVGAIAGPETIQTALAKLSAENERGCPL